MKLTIETDPNLQKIKKVIRKSIFVLLAIFLIALAVHYIFHIVVQKKYPDIFVKNKPLLDQIALYFILYPLMFLLLLLPVFLKCLIEKPRGQFVFECEEDDIRYRETAVYKEVIAHNKPKLKEAIKKKDLKFLLMIANDYKDRGYWVEEAEILAIIIGKDPAGKYGIQAADKMIEIDY